jgi:hypothetical protein
MYCVYCGKDHDESVVFSDEHVVPYAIGGSQAFTIRVCAASNNSLGGLVDKPFIESFIVRSNRFFLGLAGTDGTDPTLDLSGKAEINGRKTPVACTIGKDNKPELRIAKPTVVKTLTAEGEQWTVSGDPASVREIIEGKLKSQQDKGGQIKDPGGNNLNLNELEAFLAASNVQTVQPDITKTITVHFLDFSRFFAKLSLATGHYILGESFSRSVRADVLRSAMSAKDTNEAHIPNARIWPQTEEVEGILSLFRKQEAHLLGVLHGNPPIFGANFFGIDAVIALDDFEKEHVQAAFGSGRILQIELPSRKFHDQTLAEYLLTRTDFAGTRLFDVTGYFPAG